MKSLLFSTSIITLAILAIFFFIIFSVVLSTIAAFATRNSDLAAHDYATDTCNMHVTLYTQSTLTYNNQFVVKITLKDVKEVQIKHLNRIDLTFFVSVDSQLSLTMKVIAYIDIQSTSTIHIIFAYEIDK